MKLDFLDDTNAVSHNNETSNALFGILTENSKPGKQSGKWVNNEMKNDSN